MLWDCRFGRAVINRELEAKVEAFNWRKAEAKAGEPIGQPRKRSPAMISASCGQVGLRMDRAWCRAMQSLADRWDIGD